jgi:hypothetical protein
MLIIKIFRNLYGHSEIKTTESNIERLFQHLDSDVGRVQQNAEGREKGNQRVGSRNQLLIDKV